MSLPLLAGAAKLLPVGGENDRHAVQSTEASSIINWNLSESLLCFFWLQPIWQSLHGTRNGAGDSIT